MPGSTPTNRDGRRKELPEKRRERPPGLGDEGRQRPAPGRGDPGPQPIVRGPAVQGQAPKERHEAEEAGRGGARTVPGPGAGGPRAAGRRAGPGAGHDHGRAEPTPRSRRSREPTDRPRRRT